MLHRTPRLSSALVAELARLELDELDGKIRPLVTVTRGYMREPSAWCYSFDGDDGAVGPYRSADAAANAARAEARELDEPEPIINVIE